MKAAIIHADAQALPLADKSVDLTFTSPPYLDARTYGIAAQRKCSQWIDWMLEIVTEACRVTRGLVLVNCAGVTRKRVYQPGPEGLLYEWWKGGGHCWRPCYWHRVGIPGSGGKHWLRSDIEHVLCFKADSEWPAWSDNTACGHPPKWGPGGEMSYRQSNGTRRNAWGQSPGQTVKCRMCNGQRDTRVRAGRTESVPLRFRHGNGTRKVDQNNRLDRGNEKGGCASALPTLANPGNLVKANVGGGVMGHPLAHENEAPFPVALAEFFVKSFCPPGGWVLDPFGGSGTTADAAMRNGRNAISVDIRASQCDLTRRRLATPHAKRKRKAKEQHERLLFAA